MSLIYFLRTTQQFKCVKQQMLEQFRARRSYGLAMCETLEQYTPQEPESFAKKPTAG